MKLHYIVLQYYVILLVANTRLLKSSQKENWQGQLCEEKKQIPYCNEILFSLSLRAQLQITQTDT